MPSVRASHLLMPMLLAIWITNGVDGCSLLGVYRRGPFDPVYKRVIPQIGKFVVPPPKKPQPNQPKVPTTPNPNILVRRNEANVPPASLVPVAIYKTLKSGQVSTKLDMRKSCDDWCLKIRANGGNCAYWSGKYTKTDETEAECKSHPEHTKHHWGVSSNKLVASGIPGSCVDHESHFRGLIRFKTSGNCAVQYTYPNFDYADCSTSFYLNPNTETLSQLTCFNSCTRLTGISRDQRAKWNGEYSFTATRVFTAKCTCMGYDPESGSGYPRKIKEVSNQWVDKLNRYPSCSRSGYEKLH